MPRNSSLGSNQTQCRPPNRCSSHSVPTMNPDMEITVTTTSMTSTIPIYGSAEPRQPCQVRCSRTMTTTRISAWTRRIPCLGTMRGRYLSSLLAVTLNQSQVRGGWPTTLPLCVTTLPIRPRLGPRPQARAVHHPTTSWPTNPGTNTNNHCGLQIHPGSRHR